MQETIPCRAVLANRHVVSSAQCPLCSQGAEDVKHLLFECVHATSVWEELGLLPIIQDACKVDRAGQSVLEAMLCVQRVQIPASSIGVGRCNLLVSLVVSAVGYK